MLGSTRPTVSVAAGRLKTKGIINYSRSRIHILDHKGLVGESCECYQIIRKYLDSYTDFDSGIITRTKPVNGSVVIRSTDAH